MRSRLDDSAAVHTSGSHATPSPARAVPHIPAQVPGRPDANVHPVRERAGAGLVVTVSLLITVASLGALAFVARDRAALRQTLRERSALAATEVDSLQRLAAERSRIIAGLTGSGVRVVDLASSNGSAASARLFWSRASNRWTLVTHGLPQLPRGRSYQLWLVGDGATAAIATWTPHGADETVSAERAVATQSPKEAIVTEEPASGAAQPSGRVVLRGAASP